MLALMDYLYAHRSQIDYPHSDQRDGRDNISWHLSETQARHVLGGGGRMQLDCSEMGSWLLRCVGAWHWPSPGYTGSHLATLPSYSNPAHAGIGALCVFGPGDGDHEAIVHTPGADPLMFSHGRPGADLVRLSAERRVHREPVRFLSIAHL